jgi:hypothetical protein
MVPSLIALVAATLFAGAALYITFVEHPARLALGNTAMLVQWQASYGRALPLQAGLAIMGGTAGLLAWLELGGWPWLAGSIVLLANWPFTLLVIMPINKRLQTMTADDADPQILRCAMQSCCPRG